MPHEVLALYVDESGNMMFKHYLLQEITQSTPSPAKVQQTTADENLIRILAKLSDNDTKKRRIKI